MVRDEAVADPAEAPALTALVADDSPVSRRLYSYWLGSVGYTVLEAGDGDAAVELIARHRPDLVVCDTVMPGRSGGAVCRWVRETPSVAPTPILQVSASGPQPEAGSSPGRGADAYLTTPTDQATFLGVVARITGVDRSVPVDPQEATPETPSPSAPTQTSTRTSRPRRFALPVGVRIKVTGLFALFMAGTAVMALVSLNALTRLSDGTHDVMTHEVAAVQVLGELRADMQEAHALASQLIAANDLLTQDAILRNLEVRLSPRIRADTIRLESLLSDAPLRGLTRSDLVDLREDWRSLQAFIHSSRFRQIGTAAERDARLARETNDRFKARDAKTASLLKTLSAASTQEINRQQAEFRAARTEILVILAALLLSGSAFALLLSRSVVGRVRAYSAFAKRATAGSPGTLLTPTGNDEIAQLGHALNRMVTEQASANSRQVQARSFSAALQLVDDEAEAHLLVAKYLERMVPGARSVVLVSNNSANRLEARTPLPPGASVAARLPDAAPSSCLAIRTGQAHDQSVASSPLVGCTLCQGPELASTCMPLLVGGQLVGSVLTTGPIPFTGDDRAVMRDAVTQAAPVLANLRNLAVAEHRARIDPLTGLGTRSALEDVLARLGALAERQADPLSALLLDLDHFKQVNDVYGHSAGDQVLAMTGRTIASLIRASDFAARFGGEEFLVLLPATGPDAARLVAEKIREAVWELRVANGPPRVTVSVGVATMPDHAMDTDTLVRQADRALYAAKNAGRNRVVTAGPADQHPPEPDAMRPGQPPTP